MSEPDGVRWWKNGDHPGDQSVPQVREVGGLIVTDLTPGKVVKPYDGDTPEMLCDVCGQAFGVHGWMGGPVRGDIVHPGDYITGNDAASRKVVRVDPLAEQVAQMRAHEEKGKK